MSKSIAGILILGFIAFTALPTSAEQRMRTIFVTSISFTGDLGGLEGADAKCQADAVRPGSVVPAGTYRAWLSDETESPNTRFTKSFDPFVLLDGTRVADDYLDLTHGYLQHPINIDSNGKRLGRVLFWTGTKADGTSVSASVMCDGWTANGNAGGVAGSTIETDGLWSQFRGGLPCSRKARLVCFQQ